jgi:2-polyprenyl-3-methyl-5-hydroxy-6-metoxy-1,4-benzoquinol methylase
MRDADDVYGALLEDVLAGRRATEVVERDDGFIMAFDPAYLLAPFSGWNDPNERQAMRSVRGRVLDVGCGGGRVSLHLQDRGLSVVGIDSSPGAVAVSRRRGVLDVRLTSLEGIPAGWGLFDTVVFLGQNFGMLGSRARAQRILRQLSELTTATGRIVAETFDPPRRRRSRPAAIRRAQRCSWPAPQPTPCTRPTPRALDIVVRLAPGIRGGAGCTARWSLMAVVENDRRRSELRRHHRQG